MIRAKGVQPTESDAWSFSMWQGYLAEPVHRDMAAWFTGAGARAEHIHTSGHASANALKKFAGALAPRHLVPIHSFDWDAYAGEFSNVLRLADGEPVVIP